jgi:hypothetical protein
VSCCVPLHYHRRYKRDLVHNPRHFSIAAISLLLPRSLCPLHNQLLFQTSHLDFLFAPCLHPFQQSVADEIEIHKLAENHFLLDRTMLQWYPAAGENIPTPNTKDIMVFSHSCSADLAFLHATSCADSMIIKKLSSILQIVAFIHIYEAFLGIPPNFPLFKNYFFLKYHRVPLTERLSRVWAFKPTLVSASLSSP